MSAYARAWDISLLQEGYPSAQRIQQDTDRVVDEAYLWIFHAQGIIVPGLGTRHGRQYVQSIVQLPHGAKMKKKFQKKMGSPRCAESVQSEGRKSVRIWNDNN